MIDSNCLLSNLDYINDLRRLTTHSKAKIMSYDSSPAGVFMCCLSCLLSLYSCTLLLFVNQNLKINKTFYLHICCNDSFIYTK